MGEVVPTRAATWLAALRAPVRSRHNRVAFGVTALAVAAVAVWSSVPMSGRWEYAVSGNSRPSLRRAVTYEGFGAAEPWGRWTVADEASLAFARPLPARFTAVVRASAFGPNAGAPVRVCAGDVCAEGRWTAEPTDVRLDFVGGGGRRLRFEIPHPTAPGGGDTRRLGLGLVSVMIEEDAT